MPGEINRALVFDDVADLYDEVRPGYPQALIDDVLTLSGIGRGGRILEIGCGPGKATIPFARRGYEMVCLEPGPNLARLASRNCAPYPRITIENVTFEAWPLQADAFNLVICAQAFHWVGGEVGFPKSAAALRKSGAIALFWNQQPIPDTPLFRDMTALYADRGLDAAMVMVGNPDPDRIVEFTVEAIGNSGWFTQPKVRMYDWTATYTADQYLKLLKTQSIFHTIPRPAQEKLLAAVHDLVETHGGIVERPYRAVLYVAKVKA